MATERDVLTRIVTLLRSNAVKRIDFQIDGLHVRGAEFPLIDGQLRRRDFFEERGIGVRFEALPPDVGASYDPWENVFKFRDFNVGTDDRNRMFIAHECVHAWIDVRKLQPSWLTNEAAAYIGGYLYHIYNTTVAGRKPPTPAWVGKDSVHAEAFAIAEAYMNSPGEAIHFADLVILKDRILAHSAYAAIRSKPRARYLADGVEKTVKRPVAR